MLVEVDKLSNKIKERFCKDCNLSIKLFDEPYFIDRLNLYNHFFNCNEKWIQFLRELRKFKTEQDYFEHYNKVKDAAIDAIKESEAYQRFNAQDMNQFAAKNKNFPSHDIFKSQNVGRYFVSIDMVKANFTALSNFDSGIFGGHETWESFLGQFTDNKHILESKYIRQVIMGNCNPKRQVTYEKSLMDSILTYLLLAGVDASKVVFFSNDEIVIDVTMPGGWFDEDLYVLISTVQSFCQINTRVTSFQLCQIVGTKGFMQNKFKDGEVEFKCLDGFAFPFVLRHMLGEHPTENDLIFEHEGQMAKYITYPKIEISEVWKGQVAVDEEISE